jgi:arylsulfatase A-like enzyme
MKFRSLCLPLLAAATFTVAAAKPNIVYIISDELCYFDTGYMGNADIQTPHLDSLAAEGLVFRNVLAGGPSCAPTRCTLITGKHTGHATVRSNGGELPLRADEDTIASVLKKQGYATGGFGKWGLGARGSSGVPEKHGFDVFFGYYDQVHAHTYYPPYLIRNSEEVPLPGNFGLGKKSGQTHAQYVIHDAAKKWIREHASGPFFAYLPYTPPHGIFAVPEDDPAWALYKDKPWPENKRLYAAMVTMLDRHVGEIRALLKELGVEKNTLLFFSGDNGGAGHGNKNVNPRTGQLQYRSSKGGIYEGAFRVPFLVCWPGKITPGTSDFLGYFPDVFPTIAEAVGAPVPAAVNGLSFLPTLLGEKAAGRPQTADRFLYWEHRGAVAIRQDQWRAVKPDAKATWELYDVVTDTAESKNLAAQHPEKLRQLTALASSAHTPVREGVIFRTDLLERDRRSKWGCQDEPEAKSRQTKANAEE